MTTLTRICRVVNHTLRLFGLRVVRITEHQGKYERDENPLGTLVHCMVTDKTLVNHISHRPKMATRTQAEELEKFLFEGSNYLNYRRSLEPLKGWLQRIGLTAIFSFLDVGCAVGPLVPFLQELQFSGCCVGFDVAYELVASAHRRFYAGPRPYHFLQADASETPFGDSCFDVVYSKNTLVSTYDWRRTLREHLRVAKKWLLLLEVPFYQGEPDTIFYLQHSKMHTSLLCGFTQKSFLEQLPDKAHIEIVSCGSSFEVINFGRVHFHNVFIELL